MGKITKASHLGDVMLYAGFENDPPAKSYKDYLVADLAEMWAIADEIQWVQTLQQGGKFDLAVKTAETPAKPRTKRSGGYTDSRHAEPPKSDLAFMAVPSIRFFDGRGANKPWLCEIPDPLTRIAWQTPVIMHPATAKRKRDQQRRCR